MWELAWQDNGCGVMGEPPYVRHGSSHPFGEADHLILQVDQKYIWVPPLNDLDDVFRYSGQVQLHGSTRPERVQSYLVWI